MRWTRFFTIGSRTGSDLAGSRLLTTLYYLAVLVGLALLYGKGETSTVGFIYQAF